MQEPVKSWKRREPAVSGLFYPGSATHLDERVRGLLNASAPKVDSARAIISPHACYDFSGPVAAMAWKAASEREAVRTVVILSPFHRAARDAVYLTESEIFGTPSGEIEVDLELVSEVRDCSSGFIVDDIPHLQEHGIEIQLPFMKVLYPGARLVPILMGRPSRRSTLSLARALDHVFAGRLEETLFVISSNIAADFDESRAKDKSERLLSHVATGDWEYILGNSLSEEYPCGLACIAAFMASSLSGEHEPSVLATSDSAGFDMMEDGYIVQYAAVAFS